MIAPAKQVADIGQGCALGLGVDAGHCEVTDVCDPSAPVWADDLGNRNCEILGDLFDDADQLGALHHLARGVEIDENAQALDAIREVGPGGHYLGCAHTQANFKEAFWKSDLLDYKPFETWSDEGARDTQSLAAARVEKLLGDYVQPPMDPETRAALDAFVAERKAAEPDSFM